MRIVIFALCLFLLVGCAYDPSAVEVEIDPSFSAGKIQLIKESLQDWHQETNGGFTVSSISYPHDISTDQEFNVIKFINQDVEEETPPKPGLTLLGYTDRYSTTFGHPEDHVEAVIYVWDGEKDSIFNATARHEIGHAVLIDHYCNEAQSKETWTKCEVVATDPGPSIMYPSVSSTVTVQPIDSYRFCQKWGCPQY